MMCKKTWLPRINLYECKSADSISAIIYFNGSINSVCRKTWLTRIKLKNADLKLVISFLLDQWLTWSLFIHYLCHCRDFCFCMKAWRPKRRNVNYSSFPCLFHSSLRLLYCLCLLLYPLSRPHSLSLPLEEDVLSFTCRPPGAAHFTCTKRFPLLST